MGPYRKDLLAQDRLALHFFAVYQVQEPGLLLGHCLDGHCLPVEVFAALMKLVEGWAEHWLEAMHSALVGLPV